jgi:L-ribulose-5-phosphate 3-epimerase
LRVPVLNLREFEMRNIGIMQGRLVEPIENKIQCFPRENWRDEFPRAARANLGCIEWIYDLYGLDVNPIGNPIGTAAGLQEMLALSAEYKVRVLSVCADYFMDKPLLRATTSELTERRETLNWLMRQCKELGVQRIVLPFVDQSRIEKPSEMEQVAEVLRGALAISETAKVEIHLETSLDPASFSKLLGLLPHPNLKVNYDSGNSSSLGYKPADEIAAYGSRIGSVHIKDRVLGGSTVSLGSGSADFPALFDGLKRVNYAGDFILQVARGTPGQEVEWAKQNRQFVIDYLKKFDLA